MTSRNFYTRVSEHRGVSHRTGRPLTKPSHSAIRDHVEACNATISDINFKILDTTNNNTDLRILESLYIYKLKPQLNNYNCSYPLKIISSY